MPRYDYECDNCHHRFELIQSFDAESVGSCPSCHSSASRKFSLVPVIFKGSGWYVNDHAKASKNSTFSETGKNGENGKPKAGAEAKSETKAEAKKVESKKETKSSKVEAT